MKTASMLFGLVVATTGVVHANPAVKPATPRTLPAGAHALLRPAHKPLIQLTTAQPLRDSDGDMACGNVMTKGGSHHVCREKPAEAAQDPVLAAFYAPPVKSTR